VVVEFLAIFLICFGKKVASVPGNHAATWWQKLAADFPQLSEPNFFV
jgi:hypothetical protein